MKKKAIQWKSFLKSLNRNVYEIGEERVMTLEEIKSGESKNVEFKIMLPDDSKNYMKTIVAYANTSGGKIIIGVDDVTRNIVGVEPSSVFQIMDKIANSVSDMCVPQIVPDVTFQTIEEKCIVQIEIKIQYKQLVITMAAAGI